jgi:thioredoxin-like negative regulator of GroEL
VYVNDSDMSDVVNAYQVEHPPTVVILWNKVEIDHLTGLSPEEATKRFKQFSIRFGWPI